MNATDTPAVDLKHDLAALTDSLMGAAMNMLIIVGLIVAAGYFLTAFTAHGKAKATARRPR